MTMKPPPIVSFLASIPHVFWFCGDHSDLYLDYDGGNESQGWTRIVRRLRDWQKRRICCSNLEQKNPGDCRERRCEVFCSQPTLCSRIYVNRLSRPPQSMHSRLFLIEHCYWRKTTRIAHAESETPI